MATPAGLALEGGDPRDPNHPALHGQDPVEKQMVHNMHDPSVSFEEYMYYATITRAEEREANEHFKLAAGPKTFKSVIANRFSTGKTETIAHSPPSPADAEYEKTGLDDAKPVTPAKGNLGGVTDNEYKNASRAIRTAGWSSAFYLITTDILGPFSVP